MPIRVKTPELESIIKKIKSKLSTELKIARNNMKFTQNATSEMVGVELSHYQNIEHGKALPSIEVMCRISEVLRFSIDNLLIDDNTTEKTKRIENSLKYCTDEQLDIIESIVNTLLSRNNKSH